MLKGVQSEDVVRGQNLFEGVIKGGYGEKALVYTLTHLFKLNMYESVDEKCHTT